MIGMRRLALATVVCCGMPAAFGIAGATARLEASARSSAQIVGWHPVDAHWFALEVGPRERSLVIGYVSVCNERGFRPRVRETARNVTIHIRGERAVSSPPNVGMSCPPGRIHRVRVALAHPLAGRPILGRPAGEGLFGGRVFSSPEPVPVPSLVGFAPADAERALAIAYLRAHVAPVLRRPGRRVVTAQRPQAGAQAPDGSLVTLTVAGR